MATAAVIEDAITCCICFNVYRDPHALPCLHTLCKPCINRLAFRGKVECPECREISQVRKIRKDFKTQNLIDAHNGKAGENGGVGEVCGMCRKPGKVATSHCKECEYFMCTGCHQAHKAIRVCRGHTVRAVKDIILIAQSKLEDCVKEWKEEKNKTSIKAREDETSVISIQGEAKMQIKLTNQHFDNLIRDLEKKRSELVNKIKEENYLLVKSLRKNKGCYDQLSREIQSKIDMLQQVIKGKHVSTMNNMVDDMSKSLKQQVIKMRKQVEGLYVQAVFPVRLHFDKSNIDTGIRLEKISQNNKSMKSYDDYSQMKTNQYKLSGSEHCHALVSKMCIIQDNIWCAAWSNGIKIYDKNMQLVKKIEHEKYSYVKGLAEWHGDVIVACDGNRGLHQITQAGDYVQEISKGEFHDVSSNGKYVYGLKFNEGIIFIFTYENNTWLETGKLPIQTTDNLSVLDKVFVNRKSILVSLYKESCIQKYSLGGELQQTISNGGNLTGRLNGPIILGVDSYDNVLVVYVENKLLKVYNSVQEEWHVVPVNFDSKDPFYAVMDENNIWVVTCFPSQIQKFTKV